jgi:HSP20 family protein
MLALYHPIDRISRDLDLVNQVFGDVFGDAESRVQGGVGAFPLDLREDLDVYLAHAELPGFDKGSIEVNLEDNLLTITARKQAEVKKEGESWLFSERSYGEFRRSVRLPGKLSGEAEAKFDNGVLEVRVRKAEESKPRKITIN